MNIFVRQKQHWEEEY